MAPTRVAGRATLSRARSTRRRKTRATAKKSATSSSVINMRTDEATRALIDRAAKVLGQNRTEFMLASARIHAQEVILNQVYFELEDDDWKALNDVLDSPPPPNEALKRLMSRTPIWER